MINRSILSFLFIVLSFSIAFAQDEEGETVKKKIRPVSNTFESIWLIDNQTVMVPFEGTFEMDMLHRFGTIKKGYEDFWGLYASGNIRIGFNYVPVENLQLGFGFTKERLLWDLNAKYALIRQGRDGGSPVSMTYFVNMGIDTRDGQFHEEFTDRISYFHQLMMARKLSDKFSLQTSLSVSHFNYQELAFNDRGELQGKMKADHLALGFLGRYMLNDVTGLIACYDLPLTDHSFNNPKPNLGFGIEFTTSSHAFQIFLSNYQSIMPQFNNARNINDPGEGEFVIGFNITRLWNF
jgi:hypothetical protein